MYTTSDQVMTQMITPLSTLNVLGGNLINIAIKNQHKKVRSCQMCGKFKKFYERVESCSFSYDVFPKIALIIQAGLSYTESGKISHGP